MFFYVDNRMLASTNPGWIQIAFDTLNGIFNRVGLQKNAQKTVWMVCQPCQASWVNADKAYTWQMTGEGQSYKERQRERVLCPECGKDLEKGSLFAHCQIHHGVAKWGSGQEVDKEVGGEDPRTLRMLFLAKSGPRPCPVKGFSGRSTTWTVMRVHFRHWHFRDTVLIL